MEWRPLELNSHDTTAVPDLRSVVAHEQVSEVPCGHLPFEGHAATARCIGTRAVCRRSPANAALAGLQAARLMRVNFAHLGTFGTHRSLSLQARVARRPPFQTIWVLNRAWTETHAHLQLSDNNLRRGHSADSHSRGFQHPPQLHRTRRHHVAGARGRVEGTHGLPDPPARRPPEFPHRIAPRYGYGAMYPRRA